MKVKRMQITEILRKIWLFSANKMESFSKQPTQLIFELNSSLGQKLGTIVPPHWEIHGESHTELLVVHGHNVHDIGLYCHIILTWKSE